MPQVSNEQIELAKSITVLDYLRSNEPDNLNRETSDRFTLRNHDSLVLTNNKWHWFSHGIGGYNSLDFLVKVRGMAFAEAVLHLTDGRIYQAHHSPPPSYKQTQVMPPNLFILSPSNINNDRVIAYLRWRGIDNDIVKRCIKAGTLYESKSHSCVFVGFDDDTARFACERGISGDLKKDVSGSNKRFSFSLPPKNPDSRNLAVMEAPVDVLSHATLHKISGDTWDGYRLSLGGVSSRALMSFLERYPQIENVLLCLDCDKAGKDATNRIIRELLNDKRFAHLKITVAPPPLGKDYADTLQSILQLNRERTRHDRPKEAAFLF